MIQTIGTITLNIATVLYLIHLFPQVVHNQVKQKTASLSLGMHSLLLWAYCCDFVYAFGRGMPWQYKLVTIIGLILLAVQHSQLFSQRKTEKNFILAFIFTSGLALIIMIAGGWGLVKHYITETQLITFQVVSQIGWLTYALPQLFKNWQLKTTEGLSKNYIYISISIALCDSVSAWCLNWDWPIKIGSPTLLLVKFIILLQFYFYAVRKTE
jgi:uncharacterized protein with PQ loop repeat